MIADALLVILVLALVAAWRMGRPRPADRRMRIYDQGRLRWKPPA